MNLDAQVPLFNQVEARTDTRVGGEIETDESVTVPEVDASEVAPLVLPHLTSRGDQVEITPDVTIVVKIRLDRFGGFLSSVHVHGKEVDVVVLGVKRILDVRTIVRVIVYAAQHQTFWQGAEEQALVRVRADSTRDGTDFAVGGTHRIRDRALVECLDKRYLHGRTQGGFLREQGGVDDLYCVIRVCTTSHERERVLAAYQSYLDIDTVKQVSILQEQFHMESSHHFDDVTLRATNPIFAVSPSAISKASMRSAVSLYHS